MCVTYYFIENFHFSHIHFLCQYQTTIITLSVFHFWMRKYFENFPMMERVLNFFFFGLSFLNKIDHFFKILIIIFYFIFFSLFWKFKISLNRTTSTKIFNNIPPLFFFVLCFFVVVLIHITATQKKNFSQFFSISSWSLLLK